MKFFNSDKSGFLSFVAKRMKALFALFFIIAGTSSVWGQSFYVAGNGDEKSRGDWCDGESWSPSSSLMTQQGNIYVKQFADLPANDDYQFKIVKDGDWDNGSWGFSNYQSSSDNTNFISGSVSCSDAGGNIKFSLSQTANVTVVFDFTNNRVAVYSSSVEIGLIGSFINNWNLEQQIMGTTGDGVSYTWDLSSSDISLNNSDEFKFISGTSWDNNNNQWGGPLGGPYTIPASASTDGTIYNVDIVHHKECGNVKFDVPLCPVTIQKIELNVLTNDLKITTGESSTEPDPVTPTADSYVVTWAEPVYDAEAGTVVLSATVAAAENAGFALADGTFEAQINVAGLASSARTTLSESNQYTISHTISGVAANQQIDYSLQIVTGGGSEIVLPSDVQKINPQTYTVPESVEPGTVSLYLIGSGTSAKWEPANALPFTYENGVYTWTGELTVNNEAFKILTSNTEWEPAYVAETNQFEVVLGETIVLHYREKTGDTYTWDDNKFKITEGGEYTIKVTLGADNSGSMIVTKKSDPAYSATITADASTAEQVSLVSTLTETAAGTDLATATCVFQYKAADAGDETYADMSETASVIYSDEGATRKATLSQSMDAGSYVFRAVWTYNSVEVANAVTETVTIPSDTPTPTDIDFYVRGEKIGCTPSEGGDCWGVASEEFKATSKEGNVYVWNWISEPKLMVGPFKIADAKFSDENNYGLENENTINLTDGKWTGTLQVNTASGDMEISEPGWNVSKITFDYDTKKLEIFATEVFKDIWFRSSIVENGWGDDISDPIGSGVSPKYQGQTTDGKVYTWDWSGSKAVTLESGTGFKFGEYTGNASWGNAGYGGASDSDKKLQSSSFGQTLNIVQASGNEFIPQEKITITGITLNIQDMTVVFTGEAYVDRYPVTLNIVNGETGGTVIIDPEDISSLAIGETVTVTANANEGYVPVFEASNGCQMTDGDADNIKVFEVTAANPVITVTFQVQCQTVEPGFEISGQFNAGIEDADGLYQGSPISSRETETDPADGYWSDGARFIQLTANNVPANYFEWVCTDYAIDGVDPEIVPVIEWTDQYKTSARAELSLPGTYTFVCKARCNEADGWTESAAITITAPVPEMGFNGNIVTNRDWGNPEWAGQRDGGYMTRRSGSLTWVSNPFTVDGFGTDNQNYHFVIDQRYKFLGCVKQNGWTENNECNDLPGDGNNKDNKINRSNLTFKNVAWDGNQGANFAAINPGAWVANETRLQLTVTMTGWDSYTVALEEVSQECTTPADNFAISARLNQGSGAPFEGNLVASGSNTATGGYFADDFRTVTLTTTQVADTYEWKLVGYAIDGNAQATAVLSTLATITNGDAQTATALLNLPGDYTFQCTAACTDGTPVNSATVTISTYPEIGFDGPIATPGGWNHAWAGTDGLMNRAQGSLTWSKTFIYQSQEGLSDQNCFVVIQRYKLGCIVEASQGWAGFNECGGIDGNKINRQDVEMSGVHLVDPGNSNYNFVADDVSAWTPGVTELTLTVTMTGWDSYTVELSKKQEQIFAYYSSNDKNMGTVTMKVGDTPIKNGDDITAYIGQKVTLTASPAQGYKVASWKINGKETESDRTTIEPKLSGDDLNVVVTFERDCNAGVAYDLTGGGVICAKDGSTELSLNTLKNVTYQLYKDGAKYKDPVQGNGEAAKWTISETGTYTAKAYDSRHEECQEQAIDMNRSAVVTSVTAPKITVNPGADVHLTVLQARSFTADVPVDWSITEVTGSGDYCEGNGYMISSKTDTSLVAKFLCIGTAKITATMKATNQDCKAEVTVTQNGAEDEVCAPEPQDVQ